MNDMGIPKRIVNRAMPVEIAKKIRDMGKVFTEETPAATQDIYTPLLAEIKVEGVDITMDHAYGPDAERHLLDVHTPTNRGDAKLPVVIFFHGGGLVRGHKNSPDGLMYANIANYFAMNGVVGVNATYRLAPDIQWPEGGRDVGAALAWVRQNIADFGGDPDRVFLMGQSAGATHVSTYALRAEMHPAEGPGFAGVILMSGVYGLEKEGAAPNRIAYYGDDVSTYDEMQLLGNATYTDCPIFLTVGEFDTGPFEKATLALISEITESNGVAPRFKQLMGHNHISQVCCFGTEDESVSADMLDFIFNN